MIQDSNALSFPISISVIPAALAVEHDVPQARIAGLPFVFTVGNGRVSV